MSKLNQDNPFKCWWVRLYLVYLAALATLAIILKIVHN